MPVLVKSVFVYYSTLGNNVFIAFIIRIRRLILSGQKEAQQE